MRMGLGSIIASIARHQIPADGWPELSELMMSSFQHPNPEVRELSMMLFSALLGTVPDHMKEQGTHLMPIFSQGLEDADSSAVRLQALRCASQLLNSSIMEEEIRTYQPLIPEMLRVVEECLSAGDEETARSAFESFCELAESESPLLAPYVESIVEFLLRVLGSEDLEVATKRIASDFLEQLIHTRPKAFAKRGLVVPVLKHMLELGAQLYEDPVVIEERQRDAPPGTVDDYEDQVAVTAISARVVEAMADEVPSKYYFKPLIEAVSSGVQNPAWQVRRSALAALSMSAEGMRSPMRDNMHGILGLALPFARDEAPSVREGVCHLLSQLGEHVGAFVVEHHQTTMPVVLELLNDPVITLQERALTTLESMCDALSPADIMLYFDTLMDRLGTLVQSNDLNTRTLATSALGSMAVTAGEQMRPYFPSLAGGLLEFMHLSDEAHWKLRAHATATMGYVARAVGREVFEPFLHETDIWALVAQNFQLGDDLLSEYTFVFFSQVADVLREDLSPMLDDLVQKVLEVLDLTSGHITSGMRVHTHGMGSEILENVHNGPRLTGDEDDEDSDDDYNELAGMAVKWGVCGQSDLKASAIVCLGSLFEHCGPAMTPYIDRLLDKLRDMLHYYDENVRGHVVLNVAVGVKCRARCDAFAVTGRAPPAPAAGGGAPGAGAGVPCDPSHLSEATVRLLLEFAGELLQAIMTEDSKEVVGNCLEAMKQWVEFFGLEVLDHTVPSLVNAMVAIFEERTECQNPEDTDDEEEDGEGHMADHDHVLMDVSLDTIGMIARVGGPSSVDVLAPVWPHFVTYCRQPRPAMDRAVSVGTIGEVAMGWGPAIVPKLREVAHPVMEGVVHENGSLRRNAAFSLGAIFEFGGKGSEPMLQDGWRALLRMCRRGEGVDDAATDNVASALARAMMQFPETVDVGTGLDTLLHVMPLREDEHEHAPVFRCLIGLMQMGHAAAQERWDRVILALTEGLLDGNDVPPPCQREILDCLLGLFRDHADATQRAFQALPESVREEAGRKLAVAEKDGSAAAV